MAMVALMGMVSVTAVVAVMGVMRVVAVTAVMGVVGVMRASRRDAYAQAESRERGHRHGLAARRPRCQRARQGHGPDCPATS